MYHHSFFILAPIAIECLSRNKKKNGAPARKCWPGLGKLGGISWQFNKSSVPASEWRKRCDKNGGRRSSPTEISCRKMAYHSNYDIKAAREEGKAVVVAFELIIVGKDNCGCCYLTVWTKL